MSGQADQPSASEASSQLSYADTTTPRPHQVAAERPVQRGDVAFVALRVVAIYIIVNGLSNIVALADIISSFWPRFSIRIGRLLPSMIWLIVEEGIGFWLFISAARLSEWMLPKQPGESATAWRGGDSSEWQSAAFAVVGVALAVLAVPEIVWALVHSRYQSMRAIGPMQFEDLSLRLVRPLVQLGLGIWLFFGSHRLALVWRKMRSSDRL